MPELKAAHLTVVPSPAGPATTQAASPAPPPFKLEGVIVCTGYADFLAETLPHNKRMFDRLVVVTEYEDKATRKLCEFHGVQCLPTDAIETRKGVMRKGAGINAGLAALAKDGWVLHLDADIWLPPEFRTVVQSLGLCPQTLYGIDRFMVTNYTAWRKFLSAPVLQQENQGWVHPNTFPLGTRVMSGNSYVPIGFFQLWNAPGSGVTTYPEGHASAAREDGLFALQFPRSHRALLPEIIGYHLESEFNAAMGANWGGRKTKPFGLEE